MLSSLENKDQLHKVTRHTSSSQEARNWSQIYAETWAIPVTDYPAALGASVFCVMQKQLSRIIGTQFDLLSP